jgi:biopolymer transport protein ExbD
VGMDLGGGKAKVRPVMNVTPLVDVVLVLLIIFMVIAPNMGKQMSVSVPVDDKTRPAPPPAPDDEPQVVLSVAADGTARIGVYGYADADVPRTLRRVFAARTDQTLFFDASSEVPFGRAVEVLDIARGAGIATVAVLTESIE